MVYIVTWDTARFSDWDDRVGEIVKQYQVCTSKERLEEFIENHLLSQMITPYKIYKAEEISYKMSVSLNDDTED